MSGPFSLFADDTKTSVSGCKKADNPDLTQQILAVLRESKTPMTVTEISTKISDSTKSDLNSALYKGSKLFTKTMEPGSKAPRWAAKFTEAEAKCREGNQEKILKYLAEKGSTLTSSLITELKIERSELNALLYSMQKSGIVSKKSEADGTKPMWSLTSK